MTNKQTTETITQGVETPSTDPTNYASIDSLGSLLSSVPELSTLLDEAMKGNWSASKFQNEVQDSKWWKSHSDTTRQVIIQRANDPAAFQQSLNNTTGNIQTLARQLGFSVNSVIAKAIANHALLTGNDNNQQWIEQQLGHRQNYNTTTNLDTLKGQMATVSSQLSEQAAQYGMNWTPAEIAQRAQQVVEGNTSAENYTLQLKQWAKSAFPALSKEIDAGQTVQQLASPYVQSMSQLLEVNPGSLNLYTPVIRRALQGVQDPRTKERTTMNLSDFEDQVRNDPRWQYTQNAKDTMSSSLLKVGADFGFGPAG